MPSTQPGGTKWETADSADAFWSAACGLRVADRPSVEMRGTRRTENGQHSLGGTQEALSSFPVAFVGVGRPAVDLDLSRFPLPRVRPGSEEWQDMWMFAGHLRQEAGAKTWA